MENTVSTVSKVLDILLLFSAERPEVSIEDIQSELMLPKSTVYRYVRTLQEKGFLHKSGVSNYRPGLAFVSFSQAMLNSDRDLRTHCLPAMRRLSEKTRESISLMRLLNKRVVCIESIQGQYALRVTIEPGRTQVMHAGASSKVLLAYLAPKQWETYLETPLQRFTDATITDVATLSHEIKHVRSSGHAISNGEIDIGARAVAVPLSNTQGGVIAALSVEAPHSRMDDTTADTYIAWLKEEAGALGSTLDQVFPAVPI